MGDRAIKEASERIQAAVINEDYEFPKMKIVINLAPGDLKKKDSHFDLGMAIGLFLQSNQIVLDEEKLKNFGFVGELSLNGRLRPCSGVLPMVIAAREADIENMIVPTDNAQEASLVKSVNIYGFEDLRSVIYFIEGKKKVEPTNRQTVDAYSPDYPVDFSEVKGQDVLID